MGFLTDVVYKYVKAAEHTPLIRASGQQKEFHFLADSGGAVLAGRECGNNHKGYQIFAWILDYRRTRINHDHSQPERTALST